jgi:twitching motility protein PilT
LINAINQKHCRHIITIEDPVEYIFHDNQSIIEQREIGRHTHSFDVALRSSLREDPDIIVVGEIRDVETAESILHAVNTGHLVFSTVHTLSAKETINRLVGLFPSQEEHRVRHMLAGTLEAIISQRLIKSTAGNMVPAIELMFKSQQIQELIRNKRDEEITDAIEKSGVSYGSITFNRALFNLTLQGKITEEEAYQYATSPTDLKVMFTMSSEYDKRRTY